VQAASESWAGSTAYPASDTTTVLFSSKAMQAQVAGAAQCPCLLTATQKCAPDAILGAVEEGQNIGNESNRSGRDFDGHLPAPLGCFPRSTVGLRAAEKLVENWSQ
jgi:hypothetical protein